MLELILAWLPLVVIFAVFVGASRVSMKSYSRHVDRVEAVNRELVAANLEMVAELREIKQILKDRA